MTPVFSESLAFAVEQAKTYGYVQFQTRRVNESTVVSRSDRSCLVQPAVTPLRTSAQVVSRLAAEKLLILSELIDRPVDAFLQSHWHTGLHVTCVVPSGIEDRTQETGGSTISPKRSIWAKMKREFKREFLRGRYRIAVNRLSKSAKPFFDDVRSVLWLRFLFSFRGSQKFKESPILLKAIWISSIELVFWKHYQSETPRMVDQVAQYNPSHLLSIDSRI